MLLWIFKHGQSQVWKGRECAQYFTENKEKTLDKFGGKQRAKKEASFTRRPQKAPKEDNLDIHPASFHFFLIKLLVNMI